VAEEDTIPVPRECSEYLSALGLEWWGHRYAKRLRDGAEAICCTQDAMKLTVMNGPGRSARTEDGNAGGKRYLHQLFAFSLFVFFLSRSLSSFLSYLMRSLFSFFDSLFLTYFNGGQPQNATRRGQRRGILSQ